MENASFNTVQDYFFGLIKTESRSRGLERNRTGDKSKSKIGNPTWKRGFQV